MPRTRRSLLLSAVALVPALALPAAPKALAKRDRDCSDFKSWKKAQRFFKRNGGPKQDPHRLDADGDGVACEELKKKRK